MYIMMYNYQADLKFSVSLEAFYKRAWQTMQPLKAKDISINKTYGHADPQMTKSGQWAH